MTNSLPAIGQKIARRTGHKTHLCTQCDFPIAVYGRLEPCSHAFCLNCAESQKVCHLCSSRIEALSRIDTEEGGLYICGAPGCLVSFYLRSEFFQHVKKTHADLIARSLKKANPELSVPHKVSLKSQNSGPISAKSKQDSLPLSSTNAPNGPQASTDHSGPRPSGKSVQSASHWGSRPQGDKSRSGEGPPPPFHDPRGPMGFPDMRMAGPHPPDFYPGQFGPMMGPPMGPMGGPPPIGPDFGPMGGPPGPFPPPIFFPGPHGNFRPGFGPQGPFWPPNFGGPPPHGHGFGDDWRPPIPPSKSASSKGPPSSKS